MLGQALQIATDIRFIPLLLDIIVSVGELLSTVDDASRVSVWLDFVYQYPNADHRLKSRAAQIQARLDRNNVSVLREGHSPTLQDIIAEVQSELTLTARQEYAEIADKQGASPQIEPLTVQEQKVLHMLAQGLTNAEIATALTVVVGTVKTHNHHIYSKLGVDNRTQAIIRAREFHLI